MEIHQEKSFRIFATVTYRLLDGSSWNKKELLLPFVSTGWSWPLLPTPIMGRKSPGLSSTRFPLPDDPCLCLPDDGEEDFYVALAGCIFLVLMTWHVALVPADINEPIVQVQNSEDMRTVMKLIDVSDTVVIASENYRPLPWYYRGISGRRCDSMENSWIPATPSPASILTW